MRQIRTYSNDEALVKERREQIARKAAQLFARKGYRQTTSQEIAESVGLSKGGLYHYVGSKDDVLHLIIEYYLNRQPGGFGSFEAFAAHVSQLEKQDMALALGEALRMMFETNAEDHNLDILVTREIGNLSRADQRRFLERGTARITFVERLLRRGVEAGVFRVRDPRLVANVIDHLSRMWNRRFLYMRDSYSWDTYLEGIVEFITDCVKDHTRGGALNAVATCIAERHRTDQRRRGEDPEESSWNTGGMR